MKKLNNKYFFDNAGFLAYKVNTSLQKLPYSQICGSKVGTSYKKRRHNVFMFQMYTVSYISKKIFVCLDTYFRNLKIVFMLKDIEINKKILIIENILVY